MKTATEMHRTGKNHRGVAVVTVLVVISLVFLTIVTFLISSRTEKKVGRLQNDKIRSRDVADVATKLVVVQIRDATAEGAWASQPGVIRKWNKDGSFDRGFKLYSDETMIERDEKSLVFSDFAELVDTDWNRFPWIYTDLNEPVASGSVPAFPIADPGAQDRYAFDGFAFNQGEESLTAPENPLPMPVKWIYQLKDGSLGTLSENRKFVPFREEGVPSERNRIVARFAFWADDETCKSNPNIHAGGLAWDSGFAGDSFSYSRQVALLPAHNESQRYSGHPANTSMAPLFFPGKPQPWLLNRKETEKLYDVVPRIAPGGSRNGTDFPDWKNKEKSGVNLDQEPLFASVDEVVFNPDRSLRELPGVATEDPADFLDKAEFFLTVSGASPEVTFGGLPRVSLWPVSIDEDEGRTPLDKAISAAAEIERESSEPLGFYFQRKNADSATADYSEIRRNQELYSYLAGQLERDISGIGKSFADKYSKHERLQILTQIFDYIRCTNLHDDALFGAESEDFRLPYDQNSSDHVTFTNGRVSADFPAGEFQTSRNVPRARAHKGHGQVTPIVIENEGGMKTKGHGRFFTLQEMAVQVIACADGGDGTGGGESRIEYRDGQRIHEPPLEEIFSNFPPLPFFVKRGKEETWPNWLTELAETDPDLLDRAFDPREWNWQLAWLDPNYEAAMPQGKFDRSLLVDPEITRLKAGERLVQAGLIWSMVCPAAGSVPINPDMLVDFSIDGMQFNDLAGNPVRIGWRDKIDFGLDKQPSTTWRSSRVHSSLRDGPFGGIKDPRFFQSAGVQLPGEIEIDDYLERFHMPVNVPILGRTSPLDRNFDAAKPFQQYYYVTRPFRIADSVSMTAGQVSVRIYSAGRSSGTEFSAPQVDDSVLVQELELGFPPFEVSGPTLASGFRNCNVDNVVEPSGLNAMTFWSLGWEGANPLRASVGRLATSQGYNSDVIQNSDVVQSVVLQSLDSRSLNTKIRVGLDDAYFRPHHRYEIPGTRQPFHREQPLAHHFYSGPNYTRFGGSFQTTGEIWPLWYKYPVCGIIENDAQKYGDFDTGFYISSPGSWINKPMEGNGHYLEAFDRDLYGWDPTVRDWDWWNLDNSQRELRRIVTFPGGDEGPFLPSYYTPNRIVNSPGVFGSLAVGTTWDQAWRTLLFRPNVGGKNVATHPGGASDHVPADHRIMDLFWMPIVEPWGISENFSTRGKVNLNYQILPFRHIERTTALRGVLDSETMLCVPNKWIRSYKRRYGLGYHWRDNPFGGDLREASLRMAIGADDTLDQFGKRFEDSEHPTIFRTASEICDIHLVPAPLGGEEKFPSKTGTYVPTLEQMENGRYWSDHALVGEDARERPYSNIYSRVTTRSNSFKVHVRAQALIQAKRDKGEDYSTWNEETDQVVSEHRGSATIERYLDFGNAKVPDYATDPDAPGLDSFYTYQIVHSSPY